MPDKSITIIEFDYHAVVLRNFCKMVENMDLNINILTTESIWNKVGLYNKSQPDNINLFVKPVNQSLKTFTKLHKEIFEKSDIILFNTIASHFKLFNSLKYNGKIIIRIHNSNTYFNNPLKTFSPRLKPFYIWKDTSHIIRKTLFNLEGYYRKRFLKKADYYAFPANTIRNYAIQNFNIPEEKAITIPFSFAGNINDQKDKTDSPTTITVIGKVDFRNRDYDMLYEAFKNAINTINNPIRLIFLGKSDSSYGKKITSLFSKLQSSQFEFIYFRKYVKQEVFSNYLKNTDFLILPIKQNTRFTIFREKYGLTKISGNIDDVIINKKPGLITANYPLEDELQNILEPFHDKDELTEKIIDWVENKKYQSKNVDEALAKYNLPNVQKQFSELIQNL